MKKPPQGQKLPWRWKGKQGYRIIQPGKPDEFYWKDGKRLSPADEDEYLDDLQWP